MCEKSSKQLLKRLANISVIACSDSGNNQCFDFANLVWHLVFIRLTTLCHRITICKELELHKHPQQNHEVNQETLTRYMSFCLSCPFVENWYKLNQPAHHFWTLDFSRPLFINYPSIYFFLFDRTSENKQSLMIAVKKKKKKNWEWLENNSWL